MGCGVSKPSMPPPIPGLRPIPKRSSPRQVRKIEKYNRKIIKDHNKMLKKRYGRREAKRYYFDEYATLADAAGQIYITGASNGWWGDSGGNADSGAADGRGGSGGGDGGGGGAS